MILILDNYDSFTYNLFQLVSQIGVDEVVVVRNDEKTVDEIVAMRPTAIIIGPGPGRPEGAGVAIELVQRCFTTVPLLGVCLGHQIIAAAFGATIIHAQQVVHGKVHPIQHDGHGVFRSIPQGTHFTRYHSLAVDQTTLADEFVVSAHTADGEIMGIRHRDHTVEGIQFHPESIASGHGMKLLRNFLHYRRAPFMIKQQLEKVVAGADMTLDEATAWMTELTDGNLSDIHIGAFLVALNSKGIVADEIAGCATVLKQKCSAIQSSTPTLDTCGTGGDGIGTFNISSVAALVAASCGAVVAKHGNRAVSSTSGSADLFRAMGMDIDLQPFEVEQLLAVNRFAFLFAPLFHGAMKYAAPARQELRIKTIMNLLGPLVNPTNAQYQILGVYSKKYLKTMAQAAQLLGVKRGLVVHGHDGQDELSVTGRSSIIEITDGGALQEYEFDPTVECGIAPYRLEQLMGGDARANAQIAMQLLEGGGEPALVDSVSLNAGAALFVYGITPTIADGYRRAKDALQSRQTLALFHQTLEHTTQIKEQSRRRVAVGGVAGDGRNIGEASDANGHGSDIAKNNSGGDRSDAGGGNSAGGVAENSISAGGDIDATANSSTGGSSD